MTWQWVTENQTCKIGWGQLIELKTTLDHDQPETGVTDKSNIEHDQI